MPEYHESHQQKPLNPDKDLPQDAERSKPELDRALDGLGYGEPSKPGHSNAEVDEKLQAHRAEIAALERSGNETPKHDPETAKAADPRPQFGGTGTSETTAEQQHGSQAGTGGNGGNGGTGQSA